MPELAISSMKSYGVDAREVDARQHLVAERGGEVEHVGQVLADERQLRLHEVGVGGVGDPDQRLLDHADHVGDADVAEVEELVEVLVG